MRFPRRFTQASVHPFDAFEYETRRCLIQNADGSVVFEMDGIEVPRGWSQLASDILISKYIRKAGVPGETGRETSVKQVVGRIARTIREAGERAGYFASSEDAETFEHELLFILLDQRGAFNSPVWFNLGLYPAYGIAGGGGNWHWNEKKGCAEELSNNYEHPQCSACFIQSIDDDLMSIFSLLKNEARIFKYGSGTGTNFSNLRGSQERLSGGGTSSGLMSFLEVFDRAAGATKSGGTTRRAAKMICLDADHPEIREFINWKRVEEKKARALIAQGYDPDFNGDAYRTVSGQNGNNSIRVADEFMRTAASGGLWETRFRTTGEVSDRIPASELMRDICESAWECADPGLQFHTTINDWHTCAASGPIRASNPCSEFMFLDDTACNLASINLIEYVNDDGSLDIDAFRHTVRILILAQEILVDASSYPTERIAANSHLFRPLGLGYANLGTLLMVSGLPYDSEGGRAVAAAITALMTGCAYRVSAEIAERKGAFDKFGENRDSMLRVIRKHRTATEEIASEQCPDDLLAAARAAWDDALEAGERHGYRNAQTTVLAPTGTIGLLMDCDTTGIEPDFALVKFKKLAGGGYFKIVNRSVEAALERFGYRPDQVRAVVEYVRGTRNLEESPYVNTASLEQKGLTAEDIGRVEEALPSAFDLEQAFSAHVVGEAALKRLGIAERDARRPGFSLLAAMGFTPDEIEEATQALCGTMTVEGAPHLSPEHYAVFDCASKCGKHGKRYIEPMGHIRMMSAVQPFLSGAISKTVNLPHSATIEDIENIYAESWRMGLKAVALYRDGCKSSQPLSATKKTASGAAAEAGETAQLELFPEIAEYGPKRRPLPKRRRGITVEGRVGGHKVYLRTGDYEDGNLGEIFIDMHKEGSAFRSMMMCFAIAVSKGLQYGVPLREFVDSLTFTNFEPRGACDHPYIKRVTSVIDFVFRVLGLEYLGRTDFCQIKPEIEDIAPTEPVGEPVALEDTSTEGGNGRGSGRAVELAAAARHAPGGVSEHGEFLDFMPVDSPLGRQMSEMMTDAPFCDQCGQITMRNGSCYKCLNCGHSMGCS
ncbi:vitamin B12-dependent ribonucleotide reductase [Candidatus Sumerlaeota bacterium]|nr:vitamin B12-dependent ribonucleotide reductase [Candidatus Sumerlaeota bacterium]